MEVKYPNSAIKKIGVLTSGGDAPGMNACIRSIVRSGLYFGLQTFGIQKGYQGLIDQDIIPMESHDVSNIIQRGGTILQTSRCPEFRTSEGRKKAFTFLQHSGIDALIVIGGDGTFTGANKFCKEFSFPIIGIPGTIDNDLYGTDFTIGYDTAINTVVEAIDKIKDTASSHNRLFFIEVMGKDAGFIALRGGIGTGADDILIPEEKTQIQDLINRLEDGWRHNRKSSLIIVAEGDDGGGAYKVAKSVEEQLPHFDTRVTVLGHIQRGGNPSAMDRVLASRLGFSAVEALLNGHSGEMVGIVNKNIKYTPFENAIKHHDKMDNSLMQLAKVLAY